MKNMLCVLMWIICCWTMSSCSINKHMPLIKVAQQLEGNWVNQKYLDTLLFTQSPQRAHQVTRVRTVYIEQDTLSDDAQIVLSFQEGDNWILGRDSTGLIFSSVFDEELHLRVKLLSTKKMQLGNKQFVRDAQLLNVQNKDAILVQKTLFEGSYSWDGKVVELQGGGAIKGMEEMGIDAYNPVVYYYNEAQKIDQLWLKMQGTYKKYGFQFKGKKLFIYELTCPNGKLYCADNVQLGQQLFELNGK